MPAAGHGFESFFLVHLRLIIFFISTCLGGVHFHYSQVLKVSFPWRVLILTWFCSSNPFVNCSFLLHVICFICSRHISMSNSIPLSLLYILIAYIRVYILFSFLLFDVIYVYQVVILSLQFSCTFYKYAFKCHYCKLYER